MNERREIILANGAASSFLGLPAEKLKGRRCHELVHGTDCPVDGCPFDETLKASRRGRLGFSANGRSLEAVLEPVTDGQGRLLGLAHFLSEDRACGHGARWSRKDMEDFLLLAAHDIRTPLNCIQGYADFLEADISRLAALLEGARPGEDARFAALEIARSIKTDSLEPLAESARNISRLLDAIVRVSRAGSLKMNPERVETGDLIRGMLGLFETRAARSGTRIALEEMPPCTADRGALGQIFSNLLGNALKFRDPARPHVVTVSGEAAGASVVYRVADNGVGIAPEDLPEIWKIFFSRPGPAAEKGDGVGLTMSRRLAEANGGRLWAESSPGEGATFFLELPR